MVKSIFSLVKPIEKSPGEGDPLDHLDPLDPWRRLAPLVGHLPKMGMANHWEHLMGHVFYFDI
jgi:hypothetical protein